MLCPVCGAAETCTADSRPVNNGKWRRRRKKCNACNHRWTTFEVPRELIRQLPSLNTWLELMSEKINKFRQEIGDTISSEIQENDDDSKV